MTRFSYRWKSSGSYNFCCFNLRPRAFYHILLFLFLFRHLIPAHLSLREFSIHFTLLGPEVIGPYDHSMDSSCNLSNEMCDISTFFPPFFLVTLCFFPVVLEICIMCWYNLFWNCKANVQILNVCNQLERNAYNIFIYMVTYMQNSW